jgi:hypothetical protein
MSQVCLSAVIGQEATLSAWWKPTLLIKAWCSRYLLQKLITTRICIIWIYSISHAKAQELNDSAGMNSSLSASNFQTDVSASFHTLSDLLLIYCWCGSWGKSINLSRHSVNYGHPSTITFRKLHCAHVEGLTTVTINCCILGRGTVKIFCSEDGNNRIFRNTGTVRTYRNT